MQHAGDGRVVEVAAKTRTIPPALRRALQHRDRGCRFPGCGVRFGQGHHIQHWAKGGPTTLSNLVMVCRRHHRAVHEDGFRLERQPDGELQFRRPNGWVIPDVPTPPTVLGDPAERLREQNDAEGLHLDAHTATPGWLGEPLNVAYAIDVLHPLAQTPSRPRVRYDVAQSVDVYTGFHHRRGDFWDDRGDELDAMVEAPEAVFADLDAVVEERNVAVKELDAGKQHTDAAALSGCPPALHVQRSVVGRFNLWDLIGALDAGPD